MVHQLAHPDSFVYQAALNALEEAAGLQPGEVLPRLTSLLLPSESDGHVARHVAPDGEAGTLEGVPLDEAEQTVAPGAARSVVARPF